MRTPNRPRPVVIHRLLALALCSALWACGGGGNTPTDTTANTSINSGTNTSGNTSTTTGSNTGTTSTSPTDTTPPAATGGATSTEPSPGTPGTAVDSGTGTTAPIANPSTPSTATNTTPTAPITTPTTSTETTPSVSIGSGTETSPSSGSPSTVITLTGSQGDMSKYANATWVSSCGQPSSTSTGVYGVVNTITVGAAVGSAVAGTLSSAYFADNACSASLGTGLNAPIGIGYLGSLTVTSSSPASASGSADRLLLTDLNSGFTGTFSVGFASGFTRFYTGAGSLFTNASLAYDKQ